ncbi:glycosyl transferase family 17 protein [Musa troglodytarum]|uniref:Glycosyl transferase family 17 protein n=1 Tax=Musa troglodytarum TaxID=320322 RepID=A0A9E7KQM5_9LILI|nr:glycosyl transferase family 17 protein [Musa troglodytarum]
MLQHLPVSRLLVAILDFKRKSGVEPKLNDYSGMVDILRLLGKVSDSEHPTPEEESVTVDKKKPTKS